MVTEHAPKGRRGFYGSWPQIGFAGGLLISSGLLAMLTNTLSEEAFASWGWRVPFILSAVLVGIGLWVRLKIEETPAFAAMREHEGEAKLPGGRGDQEASPRDRARRRHALLGEHQLLHAERVRALLRRGRARHLAATCC